MSDYNISSLQTASYKHCTTTLKDILLRCELHFTDVAAVLVIDVSSVFFVATAIKIDATAAKADVTAVKTDVTAVNTVMTSNFETYVTTVFAAVATAFAAVTSIFTAVATKNTDETSITNTAATPVKFSSHRSKISYSVLSVCTMGYARRNIRACMCMHTRNSRGWRVLLCVAMARMGAVNSEGSLRILIVYS